MGLAPERPGMIDVELVDEDTGSPRRATPALLQRFRRRPRRDPVVRRRRARAVTAALLVAGVVTVGVVGTVQRRSAVVDAALMSAAAPDLTVAPIIEWQVPDPGAGWTIAGDLLTTVQRAEDTFAVTAVDVTTGRARWTTRLPTDDASGLACPVLGEGLEGPVLVCRVRGGVVLQGGNDDVVGTPVARLGRLVLLDARDGTVVEVRILEDRLVGIDEVGGDLLTVSRDDRLTTVERIDLATGHVLWATDLRLGADRSGRVRHLAVAYDRVVVSGPDRAVLDAVDGSVVGTWPADPRALRDPPGGAVVVAHGFGVRDHSDDPVTSWHDTDGGVRTLAGIPAEPGLGDGSEPDVVLTRSADGDLLGWVRGHTEAAWSLPLDGQETLVRAGGRVVLAGTEGLRAVDLRTGAERWRTRGVGLERAHAVSDGRFVLVTGLVPGTGYALSAVSLTDGSLLWRVAMPPRTTAVEVHAGRLVATGPSTVVGLG